MDRLTFRTYTQIIFIIHHYTIFQWLLLLLLLTYDIFMRYSIVNPTKRVGYYRMCARIITVRSFSEIGSWPVRLGRVYKRKCVRFRLCVKLK